MDKFLVVLDMLIIVLYILLIGFISPFIIQFMKKRNYDLFIQLLPIVSIMLLGSIAISIAIGGLNEMLFFKLTTIVSSILLVSLLFLTIAMKSLWKDKYDRLMERIVTFLQKNERSFSLK